MENEMGAPTPAELAASFNRVADTYESGLAILNSGSGELDILEWSNWVNVLLKEQVTHLGKLTSLYGTDSAGH